jgi:protein transport protein SEC61 subunit gamma-like protein
METEEQGFISKTKSFLLKCARVWHVTRKPTTQEFKTTASASGIGILGIGALGFFISLIVKIFGIF